MPDIIICGLTHTGLLLGFARASADLGTKLTSGSHSACQGYFGSNEAKDYVVNPIDNN
jgi:hypothetical protein